MSCPLGRGAWMLPLGHLKYLVALCHARSSYVGVPKICERDVPPWVAGLNILAVRRLVPANINSAGHPALTVRRHSRPYRNMPLHRLSYAIWTHCVKRYEYTNWDSLNKVRPSKLQASKLGHSRSSIWHVQVRISRYPLLLVIHSRPNCEPVTSRFPADNRRHFWPRTQIFPTRSFGLVLNVSAEWVIVVIFYGNWGSTN